MPDCNRNMWNYNNPVMASVRKDLDELSTHYLNEHHREEFADFKTRIGVQSEKYEEAYGSTGKTYEEGKMKDLYTRLGNAILKEVRMFDAEQRELAAEENRQEYTKQIAGGMSLASAVNRMGKGLKSEWEKARNEREHDQMMRYDAEKETRGHE